MSKQRTGDPWMPAPAYGKSLTGIGVNLLVRDVQAALEFQRRVLETSVVYADPDIAVLRHDTMELMLHADHTYDAHPIHDMVSSTPVRGIGIEVRLHHHDPDRAEARAREHGYDVVQPTADKPHGLRECFIRDGDGYIWVPDRPLPH